MHALLSRFFNKSIINDGGVKWKMFTGAATQVIATSVSRH